MALESKRPHFFLMLTEFSKRIRLPIESTLIAFCALSLTCDAGASTPNIVFILADDLAWSDLGCYGHTYHETPNLDRQAEQGMRFTQAYAPTPICSASRAAILTGKSPARLNFEFVTKDSPDVPDLKQPLTPPPYTLDLPLKEMTMAEVLAPAGYTTGFFGKWHVSQHHGGYLGWWPTHGPLHRGFSELSSDFGSHPYAYKSNPGLKDSTVEEGQYPQDTLTDQALRFIRSHRHERFFLYLSHYYVHDPIHTRCQWLVEKYRAKLPPGSTTVRADYAAMVETLDHEIGRVLDEIDVLNLADNTLIVCMSDNGGHPDYTTNAPLRGSKRNLYEGGIRVPFIVRWPDHSPAGSICDTPVHGCDLFPTFVELAGAKADNVAGLSLAPLLLDPVNPLPDLTLLWLLPY